jgi:hypothetical protein
MLSNRADAVAATVGNSRHHTTDRSNRADSEDIDPAIVPNGSAPGTSSNGQPFSTEELSKAMKKAHLEVPSS